MVRMGTGMAIARLGLLCWGLGTPAALAAPPPETWGAGVTPVEQLDHGGMYAVFVPDGVQDDIATALGGQS